MVPFDGGRHDLMGRGVREIRYVVVPGSARSGSTQPSRGKWQV